MCVFEDTVLDEFHVQHDLSQNTFGQPFEGGLDGLLCFWSGLFI